MPNALIPDNENERLEALNELGILYTPLEDRFDKITRTLCRLFYMPIAYVSLIDSGTQWIKSIQGLDLIDIPRDSSLCAHTLLVDECIIAEDLTQDDRFKDNPFVTSGLKVRFYAGFALKSRGQNIGTLCMLDDKPRSFSNEDIATMRDLVSWAQTEISLTQLGEVQIQLITDLDQAQKEAKIDDLTGLWNQGAIKEVLQRAHYRHLITEQPYSLMLVDIDDFKQINDSQGHAFGDQVLTGIAAELKKTIRPTDTIGRYGGDEFLIILENCSHQRAAELSQRLLHHSHQLTIINNDNEQVNTHISVGFATNDRIAVDDSESLLARADKALYKAKEEGRNCARG
jgi:diguanylate cyclase (GGDEF)-like protein